MIEFLKVLFLGIVEGITEWLPISSTGHMLLVDEFLRLDASESFKEMFFVVIQLGAILAVVFLFWKKMWPFRRQEDGRLVLPEKPDTADWVLKITDDVVSVKLLSHFYGGFLTDVF